MTAVPYRGGAEALAEVTTGRVDFNLADFGAGMAQHLVCCPACDEEAASLTALLAWSPSMPPPAE